MFNIIRYGNVVNISSSGIDFQITGSYVTGTSYMVAHIEAVGYSWDVTYSGTVANIKLVSGEAISGGFWGGGYYGKMLTGSWVTKQTMNDVASLEPTLLKSVGTLTQLRSPRLEMTSDYVFLMWRNPSNNTDALTRYKVTDTTSVEYDPNVPGSRYLYSFCVVSNNIVYTIEYAYDGSVGNMELKKITFTDEDYTVEDISSWDCDEAVYNGYTYEFWEHYFTGRIKYGNDDCIVTVFTYLQHGNDSPPPNEYMLRFNVYHINTNTLNNIWQIPSTGNISLFSIDGMNTSPSFYQSKMIFVLSPTEALGEYPDPFPWLSAFILDVSNNTVTKLEWTASLDSWVGTGDTSSVIDYNTHIFYFEAFYQPPDDPTGGIYLYSIDLDSPSIVLGSIFPEWESWQGADVGYGFNQTTLPATVDVFNIPDGDVITSIDVLCDTYNVDSACAIDIDKGIIWNVKASVLQGKGLVGIGSDRNITVNWSGGSIPFAYANTRKVWLRICNGVAVIMIYSKQNSPALQQQDFYLLKETV